MIIPSGVNIFSPLRRSHREVAAHDLPGLASRDLPQEDKVSGRVHNPIFAGSIPAPAIGG